MILGHKLQRFREIAGVTPDDAGYRIRSSRSKISRMENGRVGFKERDVADLLDLYEVKDATARSEMLSLARLANASNWWSGYGDVLPDWFEPYLGLESAASSIRCFEQQFIPARLGARTAELEGLGHWWMMQDSAASAAALRAFWLSGAEGGRG